MIWDKVCKAAMGDMEKKTALAEHWG